MILTQIDSESFLIKQLSFENGVIPNQVHAKELRKILDNAQKRLPFLNEKDESGLTVSERIFSLYTFHIPYYIGPVSSKSKENKGNGWVIRKNSGRVFPWNLEEKIDIAETSKEFIEKMVRRCTYIEGEMCLPKDSLMYQKYCVLNEINNIRINDERISVELKQDIYNDLFKKGKRVTRKALCKYLANRGLLKEETQLSGIDTNINSCLASYGKFQRIFGDDIDKDSCKCVVEDIIYLSTIYGDDKKLLKNKLIDKYSEILDQTAIKTILGYKFKDWGRLSKEFLELEGTDENGEIMSLISAMWNTNYNMMELINSDNFYFKQALADKQNKALKLLESFEAEDLDEYYFSAPVKRMIWQTLKIIKELKEVLGEYPDRIFIEMTRSEEEKGDKGRKDSRKKMFLDLYKKVKDENNNWAKIIEDADKSGKIRSKKMFLYLTQMGRCMYTGNPIDLDRLFTPDYDIDHIYPRSQVKDDNLSNNLVLVEKKSNADKSDVYPLDVSIRNNDKVRNHWKMLREKKLITDEKYKRLTGINPFTDDQRADFIARQLVETSQGTKGVADLLKQLLPDTTIVYVKSRNVSDFRNENDMLKSRVVNDFHHANDAYLNIVVGNVYFTKFTQNPKNFIEKEFRNNKNKNHYNLSKMYSWDVVRNGETAWIAKKDGNLGTIQTVRKMMSKNTPLMTRMSFERHGSIANETLYSAKDAKKNAYIPFKSSDSRLADVEKYGGFTKVSTAYLFLVEHEDKKGKRIRTLETVPIIFSKKIGNDISLLLKYCKENLGLINPDIRIPKINMQSLIKKNGYEFYISGKTENRYVVKNAVNLKISYEWVKYIKELEKVTMSENIIADSDEKITIANNVALYDILTKKHSDGIFAKRPNPVGDKLQEGKEKFLVLSLLEQAKLLMQILNLNVIGNTKADLSAIGQSKDSGVMLISKKISEEDNIYLVNQSVTGIYEKYIDLLTV
jgi:CRISPR-associated endonuclease Csn1